MSSLKTFLYRYKQYSKSKGNSCKNDKFFLLSIVIPFTELSHKILDQNEMRYFVYFKDLFPFCIFAIYEHTPLSKFYTSQN